jgi:hypothetical protein
MERVMRYVTINGVRLLWRDVLKMRREQVKAARQPQQETLFPLVEDSRPATQQTARGRYEQPLLFKE